MPDISSELVLILAIAIASFGASFLSFFSGFGLGTILLPVFSIFYELPVAIALTGVVHLLNNIFKFFLIYKEANYKIVFSFGLISLCGAVAGAFFLQYLGGAELIINIPFIEKKTTGIKFGIGLLIIVFAWLEFYKKKSEYNIRLLPIPVGGFISGFFGGLSGHQGALRTLFIKHLIPDKDTFIATGVVIACMVDLGRLPIYFTHFNQINPDYKILIISVTSALLGALLGRNKSKSVSESLFKNIIFLALMIFGTLMILGFI